MYRLIFWPVLAPSFLFGIGTGAMMPILVLAAIQVGASDALSSAIVAMIGAAALISTVPVGILIDRIGDKRSMTLATITTTALLSLVIFALAVPTAWSLPLFIGALIARAPASTAWNLARQSVVAETVTPDMRGQAMTALGGTMRAGNVVGPLCAALLLLWWPMWSVFAFGAVCGILATALLYSHKLNDEFDAQTQRNRESRTEEELALKVRWGAVTLAGISMIALGVARVAQVVLVALWGLHLGWAESQISFLVAVGAAIEILLMFPGGYLKDRIGRSPILFTCLAIYGAGFLLIPLWPSSLGFIVAVVVMSVGNGLGAGINMTIGADLSPARGRAKFLSIWSIYSQSGVLGGPLAVSGVLLVASLPLAVTVVGAFALAGAVWSAATAKAVGLPGRQPRHADR